MTIPGFTLDRAFVAKQLITEIQFGANPCLHVFIRIS